MRIKVVSLLTLYLFAWLTYCRRFFYTSPNTVHRILIPSQLLLGDAIFLVGFAARVGAHFPHSRVVIAGPSHLIEVCKRFGVGHEHYLWNPRSLRSLLAIRRGGYYALSFAVAEKHAPLWSRACGAYAVRAFEHSSSLIHNFLSDSLEPFPRRQMALGDLLLLLLTPPRDTSLDRWRPSSSPTQTRCQSGKGGIKVLLHVGARNSNRRWLANYWSDLADKLRSHGYKIYWSYSESELEWARLIRKSVLDTDFDGKLTLSRLIDEIMTKDIIICPDTGIAHICKLTGTPSVVIYGQGNPAIHGNGIFWKAAPVRNLYVQNIKCRDMHQLFNRHVDWVVRCDRGPKLCSNPYCQNLITPEEVYLAAMGILRETQNYNAI